MIKYKHQEEKIVALFLTDVLRDELAKSIIQKGEVTNADEAIHLGKVNGDRLILYQNLAKQPQPC